MLSVLVLGPVLCVCVFFFFWGGGGGGRPMSESLSARVCGGEGGVCLCVYGCVCVCRNVTGVRDITTGIPTGAAWSMARCVCVRVCLRVGVDTGGKDSLLRTWVGEWSVFVCVRGKGRSKSVPYTPTQPPSPPQHTYTNIHTQARSHCCGGGWSGHVGAVADTTKRAVSGIDTHTHTHYLSLDISLSPSLTHTRTHT